MKWTNQKVLILLILILMLFFIYFSAYSKIIRIFFKRSKVLQQNSLDYFNDFCKNLKTKETFSCDKKDVKNDINFVFLSKYYSKTPYSVDNIHIQRRIVPHINSHILNRNYKKNEIISNITMILSVTIDKLPQLSTLSTLYNGPISATLFLPIEHFSSSIDQKIFETMKYLKKEYPKILKEVDLHFFVRESRSKQYPINKLRNIAWEYSKTPLIFLMDLDSYPSRNFDKIIQKISKSREFQKVEENLAVLTFTSFEWKCKSKFSFKECEIGDYISQNKNDNEKNWKIQKNLYPIKYSLYFEPFIIGSRNMPVFDPIFVNDNDRISFIYELDANGYEMLMMPITFIGMHEITKKDDFDSPSASVHRFLLFIERIEQNYGYNSFCLNYDKLNPRFKEYSCICEKTNKNKCKEDYTISN